MEVRRFRNLALETFNTLNDLNPTFLRSTFFKKDNYQKEGNAT